MMLFSAKCTKAMKQDVHTDFGTEEEGSVKHYLGIPIAIGLSIVVQFENIVITTRKLVNGRTIIKIYRAC